MSWVIKRKADGEIMFETWDPLVVRHLKADYEAVPIEKHLAAVKEEEPKLPRVFDIEHDVLWASPPMKFGDHEWIVGVYEHRLYGRSTFYAFRGPKVPFDGNVEMYFKAENHWPTYSMAKRNHGMPASLAKLYERHYEELRKRMPNWT